MADDAIYRLAHRDAYNASFAARKTQKVNSVAAQAATPTRFLALKDDNAGGGSGPRKPKWKRPPTEAAVVGQFEKGTDLWLIGLPEGTYLEDAIEVRPF